MALRTALRSPLREPLKKGNRGQRRSDPFPAPPPVGGWNAKDPISRMRDVDAISLINWFPQQTDVKTRPGHIQHCDLGTALPVNTLVEYESSNRIQLLAASGGKVFNATTALPTQLHTGATSDYWSVGSMNSFQFWINGTDPGLLYNGTSFSALGFTGVASESLSAVHVHMSRAYFIEKGTQKFWYGGTEAITGALNSFDLSLTGSFGGSLKLLVSISREGGTGAKNSLVFIFDSGDAVIYQGSDPGDASNWARVGKFKTGRPLGRFCTLETDADSIVLTDKGYLSLTSVIPVGNTQPEARYLSEKIQPAVLDAIKAKPVSDDWSMMLWGTGQMLIVNLPPEGHLTEQHVRNINTGSWCKFKNLRASRWCMLASIPYFGNTNGKVSVFGTSSDDNGQTIEADAEQSWTGLGNRNYRKKLNFIQPILYTAFLPPVGIAVAADFNSSKRPTYALISTPPVISLWDDSVWDSSNWSPEAKAYSYQLKHNAEGKVFSVRLLLAVSDYSVSWAATNYIYEQGDALL